MPKAQRPNINPPSRSISLIQIVAHLSPRSSRYSYRLEIVGAASQRSVFTVLGCFVEIINYAPRVFVPTDKPEVLTAILAKWPAQTILAAAA